MYHEVCRPAALMGAERGSDILSIYAAGRASLSQTDSTVCSLTPLFSIRNTWRSDCLTTRMECRQCGRKIPFLRAMVDQDYCSERHKRLHQDELNQAGLTLLLQKGIGSNVRGTKMTVGPVSPGLHLAPGHKLDSCPKQLEPAPEPQPD